MVRPLRRSGQCRRRLALAFLVILLGWPLAALSGETDSRVVAVRTERAPALDGTLADPSWQSAAVVSDFREREPFEGQSPTERTVVRLLYDRHTLYVGVQCFDSKPDAIVATELRRDADYSVDDNFTVLISPANDRRSGYTFTVNPLGTQFDALLSDEGRTKDPNWDGIWSSSARIGPDGWTATIAIPFSTLNFKTSSHVTLGVNFRRFVRRKNEEDLWRSWLRILGIERVAESGTLAGLNDIGSGRLLVVKPYGLAGARSQEQAPLQARHTGGFDLKYGLRSGMVANITVNTDFADTDVDPVRFNITPYKSSLPEKRPFFLENSGVFPVGSGNNFQLFFSRQIGIDPTSGLEVPLNAGAKTAGSIGAFDVGVLDAETGRSGPIPAANYFVGRVKRQVLSESYVGAIVVDKESGDPADPFNRTAGLDTRMILGKKVVLSGVLAGTKSSGQQNGRSDWAYLATAEYHSNLFQAEAGRQMVGPNFNPEVGFVDRTDLVTTIVDGNLSPRPRRGPVRELNFEGFLIDQPDTHGTLQTREWQATFRALLHNGSQTDDDIVDRFVQRLMAPFNIFGNVFIPAGLYRFTRHQLSYGSDLSKRFTWSGLVRFGTYYDGTLDETRLKAQYRANQKLAFSASTTWDHFRLAGVLYDVKVGSCSASYSFSRFLTTTALAQVDSIDTRPLSFNVRLRYQYRPDSDLFIVYNIGNQFASLAAGNPILAREARLSVKFTYAFVR